jgi:Putative beta barrel porin-7 (BBP7)
MAVVRWCFILVSVCGAWYALATDPPRPSSATPPALPSASISIVAPKTTTPDIPPLGLPTFAQLDGISAGTIVSVPLQAVMPESSSLETLGSQKLLLPERQKPIPDFWAGAEYLLWWPKGAPLPPLVVSSRNDVPRYGSPSTTLLAGGGTDQSLSSSGGRIGWGFTINEDRTAALAASYTFFAGRSRSNAVADVLEARTLGRPITDPNTGNETSLAISSPKQGAGYTQISASSRVTGWEVMGLINLIDGPQTRIHALAGYRYFQANEGLRIDQVSNVYNRGTIAIADEFSTQNQFHGGLLGLTADIVHGPMFLELTGKISLGQVGQTVRIQGESVSLNAPVHRWPTGFLAQPSNIGQSYHSTLAILPEAMLKVGYRFENQSRLFLGYNLIYLSEAVRPGEQVDRTLDVANVPLFGAGLSSTTTDRPGTAFLRSDFWIQGIVVGFEYRY